jgi:hypothetical protein
MNTEQPNGSLPKDSTRQKNIKMNPLLIPLFSTASNMQNILERLHHEEQVSEQSITWVKRNMERLERFENEIIGKFRDEDQESVLGLQTCMQLIEHLKNRADSLQNHSQTTPENPAASADLEQLDEIISTLQKWQSLEIPIQQQIPHLEIQSLKSKIDEIEMRLGTSYPLIPANYFQQISEKLNLIHSLSMPYYQ